MSLRTRLTLGFAGGMAVVLAALALFVDWRVGHDLTAAIDMDLRSRGQVLVSAVRDRAARPIGAEGGLIDPDEAFAQVLAAPSGRIVDSSSAVRRAPMLSPAELRAVAGPVFSTAQVRGVDDDARLLAIPVQVGATRAVVVVGATLGDRNEALHRLQLALAIGGPVALVLVSWAGWALAGAALRPVEAMQREAAAISSSEPARRLPVEGSDELARLATTLNAMLDRLQESMEGERRFLDRASHELRTPLTVLRMELDLALSRARSPEDLRAALENASVETDRLVRLSEDLLVLGRAHDGRLSLARRETDVGELVRRAGAAHAARAAAAEVELTVGAPDGLSARVDPDRVRQAVDDLLDNALRHGRANGSVTLAAWANGDAVRIAVEDDGPGFPSDVADPAPAGNGRPAPGLGLAVVRAIAEGHGGTLVLENPGRGARAVVSLPR